MIKIAVCDDNQTMLDNLCTVITSAFSEYTDDFTVKKYPNGNLLMNEQKIQPFDVIFLDIDMPELSGFDVAKTLRDDCINCFLIFVTNYAELIYEGMDFQPFHFIRKNCNIPIDTSVSRIVKILMNHMKQNEKIILEDVLSKRYATYIRNIIYIESDKHYLTYHLSDNNHPVTLRGSLKECEEKFGIYDFVRIHKKFCVNLRYVSDIDISSGQVRLAEMNFTLPLGKSYKQDSEEKYMLFMRKML